MELKEKIKREISGFKPKVIGKYCDSCNGVLSDEVYMFGYVEDGDVRFSRATHIDCDIGLAEKGTNFKVRCEVMNTRSESIVLGNPEVEELRDES